MANSWFDFKQFRVEQENAAFKVGTDACLLGAWLKPKNVQHILDIGTGSGVIALMLAQKSTALIDAIELDQLSSDQAADNFAKSSWTQRLQVSHIDFNDFVSKTNTKYDLIVCNPPFFAGSTKNKESRVRAARHEEHLCLESLLIYSYSLTNDTGQLALVMPYERLRQIEKECKKGKWFIDQKLSIRPKKERGFNRVIVLLSKNKNTKIDCEELTLHTDNHNYTKEAIQLFKPYYLNM
tara:strand:- start:610 stop:1323 length:714 start_codon:yes stop_codon:yes gene_type:complete